MVEIKLQNGATIPAVGLGTWRAKGDDVYEAVKHAIAVGYRHVDSAAMYFNEQEVGRAIRDSGVSRPEVYLTTKLWNDLSTKEKTARAIDKSLSNLGTDYVDLLLIHWPGSYERNAAVYAAMEDAVDQGKVRSIGVSNFLVHHVNALFQSARIEPVINQVETHVHLQNHRLQALMAECGVVLEAYAPLKSDHVTEIIEDETLKTIGAAHGKTPAQVCIRWFIQRGVVVLPKSVTPSRIEENFNVFDFELTDEDMAQIRKLNQGDKTFPEPDNFDFGFPEP